MTEALLDPRAIMAKGSKSFSFAAALLPAPTRGSARNLYAWCRYCDDLVDEAPTRDAKLQNLALLQFHTENALRGGEPEGIAFTAFRLACSSHAIPEQYPLDLLEGMRLDATETRYRTLAELERYCYHVAGTVGLMMCHVLGVSDPAALPHAVALGVAMQLTNIARDVSEDFAAGRIYLPLDWLKQAGIPETDLMNERYRARLVELVGRILDRADEQYVEGAKGLTYLHWRAALAIRVAGKVYGGIGASVRAKGAHAWDLRTFTTKRQKIFLALAAGLQALAHFPHRAAHPWQPVPIQSLWRPRNE